MGISIMSWISIIGSSYFSFHTLPHQLQVRWESGQDGGGGAKFSIHPPHPGRRANPSSARPQRVGAFAAAEPLPARFRSSRCLKLKEKQKIKMTVMTMMTVTLVEDEPT